MPGEAELSGRGVSYCATCDAAFFKDRQTVIVGGGDSAMEEAMFLAKFAAKVTVVHRRDEFRASRIMLERARAVENIEFLTPYVVEELLPGEDGALGAARLRNTQTGEERDAAAVGRVRRRSATCRSPELVRGTIDLDENGYVIVEGRSTRTNRPACSPPATSSTTPTARRSRRPARAARRRSTPSGTCATRRSRRRRRPTVGS